MSVEEEIPLSLEDAARLQNTGERIFAIAVCSIPHLLVYLEPDTFRSNGSGSTTPDFLVINTRRSGIPNNGTYVEVTTGSAEHPRKQRQRKVMKKHPVRCSD